MDLVVISTFLSFEIFELLW